MRTWSGDVGVQDQALTKKLRAQRAEIEELKAKLAAADVTPSVTTPVTTGGTETRYLKITVRDYDYDLAGELRAYFAESDGYSDDDPFWKVSGVQDVTAEVTAAVSDNANDAISALLGKQRGVTRANPAISVTVAVAAIVPSVAHERGMSRAGAKLGDCPRRARHSSPSPG